MMIRGFANYQRFSEFTTIPTATTTDYDESPNGLDGNGMSYKAKLIGMEDIETNRDEKLSLDTMMRLKAIVRARGEHKQKILFNVSTSGIQVIDESTKAELVCHEIRRIPFVIMDPSDPRAFGYVYDTSDERHQFWAIKTDGLAQSVVFALRDVFEEIYKRMNNSDAAKEQEDQITSTPMSFNEKTGSSQKSSALFDDTWGGNFVATAPRSVQASQQQSASNTDPWGFSEPVVPVQQPAPRVDSPMNIFNFPPPQSTRRSTTTQPPAPTNSASDLFSLFPTTSSAVPVYNNIVMQPIQETSSVTQQQTNYYNLNPIPSVSSPPLTNPSSDFDLLGDFS